MYTSKTQKTKIILYLQRIEGVLWWGGSPCGSALGRTERRKSMLLWQTRKKDSIYRKIKSMPFPAKNGSHRDPKNCLDGNINTTRVSFMMLLLGDERGLVLAVVL